MDAKKTAIVTGASSGLGLAIAEAYLKMGYNVVGNARTAERLREAAASIGNPENFLLVEGDIGKPETARTLFARAIEAFEKVDILVANAGVFIAKPVGDFTEEDVESILDTNLKGFFYPAQEAAKHMSANGSGHIIAITACIAMQPNVKLPCLLTAMTKGGLNHAVKGLALELGSSGVQVNGVAPGIIDTPILPRGEENWAFFRTLAPNGKTGVPQDIVDAVLYLTGSDYVTGSIMTVDGGSTAGTW
ncbi:SDR family oxidoreductase [Amycolatopsis sp. La24]|uniref:SDR family NAD(P)-dependent oxidoreductase n=1 Tax=Amycolatopsis sp. La24 TaxID=3028304 RepID=UPI0023B1F1B3|nr:SDR family oxidoreductase [Amycolatopsis sp. La24]